MLLRTNLINRVNSLKIYNAMPKTNILRMTNNGDDEFSKSLDNRKFSSSSSPKNPGVGGWFNGLSKFFGQDKQSIEKRRRKEQVNQAIDKVFEDSGLDKSGLIGGLIKYFVKGMGGMVSEMVRDSANSVQSVQSSTLRELEEDSRTRSILGAPIEYGTPISTSSSTISINGLTEKTVMLVFPVSGGRSSGMVEVKASIEDGNSKNI